MDQQETETLPTLHIQNFSLHPFDVFYNNYTPFSKLPHRTYLDMTKRTWF